MKTTSWFGRYTRFFRLNTRLFLERFKLDAAIILVGLVYVYGGRIEIDITVSKGVFVLIGFLFAGIIESQIIKMNSASPSFYLKLPLSKKITLALFYGVFTLPAIVVFTALFFLLWFIGLPAHVSAESSLFIQKYFHVLFAILFIKSLTINLMIAMSIHFALIVGYFMALGGILLVLSIAREIIMPVFVMNTFVFAALFLLSTYVISFIGVKRIGL